MIFTPDVMNRFGWIVPAGREQQFTDSLYAVENVFNNLRPGNVEGTVNSTSRIEFNAMLGIAGLLDPATPMGFTKREEDFGQALGPRRADPGPSCVRDGIGGERCRRGNRPGEFCRQ
jgi:phospholipid-binding lipoprotein MlaA